MIRLNASLSKKLPVVGIDFSSVQVGASIEVEVVDHVDPSEIARRLQEAYRTVEESVDAQLAVSSQAGADVQVPPDRGLLPAGQDRHLPPRPGENGGSGGNGGNGGRRGNGYASQAQIKAIFAISKDRGISREELVQALRGEFGVEQPDDLNIKQASDLIAKLQRLERSAR